MRRPAMRCATRHRRDVNLQPPHEIRCRSEDRSAIPNPENSREDRLGIGNRVSAAQRVLSSSGCWKKSLR